MKVINNTKCLEVVDKSIIDINNLASIYRFISKSGKQIINGIDGLRKNKFMGEY